MIMKGSMTLLHCSNEKPLKSSNPLYNHICLLAGMVFLCASTISWAGVIRNVPSSLYPTIQAGINAAINGDTVLVGIGIYKGAGNVNIDTQHKAIIIKSAGGSGSCCLDGEGVNRIFLIVSGEIKTTVINGFTIQNGNADRGGGIAIYHSSPTIINCFLQKNSATLGGACYVEEGGITSSPILSNNTFYHNNATYIGGAIFAHSGATAVTNCSFLYNNASSYGGAVCSELDKNKLSNCSFHANYSPVGGAVYAQGTACNPTFSNCVFDNNYSDYGGGVTFDGTLGKVTNCTFEDNYATYLGGGINTAGGKQAISNCIFVNNSAIEGGGIRVDLSNTTVTNCSFENNLAVANNYDSRNGGGGILIGPNGTNTASVITGCLFYRNSSYGSGGGVMNHGNSIITKCVFQENNVSSYGGALSSLNGKSTIVNSVFYANGVNADTGGALWLDGSTTLTHLTNCSFSKNYADYQGNGLYIGNSCSVTINNSIVYEYAAAYLQIFNDGSAAISVNYSDIQGGWSGAGAHNINADPQFTNVGLGSLTLQPTSPCLNAANTVAPGYSTKDIVGKLRDSSPDMGAYEH